MLQNFILSLSFSFFYFFKDSNTYQNAFIKLFLASSQTQCFYIWRNCVSMIIPSATMNTFWNDGGNFKEKWRTFCVEFLKLYFWFRGIFQLVLKRCFELFYYVHLVSYEYLALKFWYLLCIMGLSSCYFKTFCIGLQR